MTCSERRMLQSRFLEPVTVTISCICQLSSTDQEVLLIHAKELFTVVIVMINFACVFLFCPQIDRGMVIYICFFKGATDDILPKMGQSPFSSLTYILACV